MNEKNVTLKLDLTLEEANVVLAALAKEAYASVAGLIGKIQQQAQAQLDQSQEVQPQPQPHTQSKK